MIDQLNDAEVASVTRIVDTAIGLAFDANEAYDLRTEAQQAYDEGLDAILGRVSNTEYAAKISELRRPRDVQDRRFHEFQQAVGNLIGPATLGGDLLLRQASNENEPTIYSEGGWVEHPLKPTDRVTKGSQ